MLERTFRSQPLVPLAAALMLGIGAERLVPIPVHFSAVAAIVCLVFACLRATRRTALLLALFSGGALLYGVRLEIFSEHDLRLLLGETETLASVRGELLETPVVRESEFGARESAYSSARVRVNEIKREESWQPAAGVIMTTTRAELGENFFAGQKFEIRGVLRAPPGPAAPGLFNYRRYLRDQRIYYMLRAEGVSDWELLPGSPVAPPLPEKFRRWSKTQLQRGLGAPDASLELIWSMTLGLKTALNGEMTEPFMHTGTMHIFAISGLHVACIGGLLIVVLGFAAGVPRHQCALLVAPLLWFYTLATGWQSSAVRSAIMATVLIMGWALKRPSQLLNSLAAAALITLALEPEQLFQAGFQLSYAVVACIALFLPAFENAREKLLQPDPFLPIDLHSRLFRWFAVGSGRWLTDGLMVSLASLLASLPIVAWYFNLVTPVSLLANLVAVPLSSIALCATVFSLVLGPLAVVSNSVAWVFMWLTIKSAELFALFPGGSFYVPKPNWAFFLFYYALLGGILSKALWTPRLRAFAIPATTTLCALWLVVSHQSRADARITMLSGAGTPIWIDRPGKARDLLIDCSNERDFEHQLRRFLRAQGVGSLRNALLTHGDINNAGGFYRMQQQFEPRTVFVSAARSRSLIYREIQRSLEQLPEARRIVSRGDMAAGWRVLHPARDKFFPRGDDNSIVLQGDIGGLKILMLSDLGEDGQRELLKSYPELRADVVLSGMPERGEPLLPELLSPLSPKLIVLGTTQYPLSARASPQLRQRLEASCPVVYYTGDHGAVSFEWRDHACRVESASGQAHRLSAEPRESRESRPQS